MTDAPGIIERLIQIEKELRIQNQRMAEIERILGGHDDRLSICESKCESLGYAELEICKGTTCIDENYNYANKLVTHFPLNSKQLHLVGHGGNKIDFILLKLRGFYNLNHLCLSQCPRVEPAMIQRYCSENNIPPIPDDAIFSNTVNILELKDSTGFEDLKIISRFPNLTKLIVRNCALNNYIHLILNAMEHTIKEIQFIRVSNMNNYTEFEKYCNAKGIAFRMD